MEKEIPTSTRKSARKQILTRAGFLDDTPNKILAAATRLFAKKGYDGTSTKEICEAAGVNIASIHYHFDSKENLYGHIIQQFASSRLDAARKTLQIPKNTEEMKVRLELFLRESIEAMIKQPDLIMIIHREMEMAYQRCEAVFRCTLLKLFETLVDFLTDSKKLGFLDDEIDPFLAAGNIFAQMAHQTRINSWAKRYFGSCILDEDYRERWINQTLRIFFEGILPNP